MIDWSKGDRKFGRTICNYGVKKVGKKAIKLVVKAPSFPLSIGVDILEVTVKHCTGSAKLARRAALIGQMVACAPLGPLAIAGGVARWKLDVMVDRF